MKKLLGVIAGIFLFIPLTTVNAVSLDPISGVYNTNEEFEAQLSLNPPEGSFNAVSVRLNVEGGEFIDFVPSTGTDWIGLTKDCDNNTSFFTINTLCLSLVKTTNLEKGELIGTMKVKLTGTTAKITKDDRNTYSNGESSVDDLGDAALYYNSAVTSTPIVSYPINTDSDSVVADSSSSNLIIIITVLILLFVIGVIAFFLLRKRKQNITLNQSNSKGKTIAVVLLIGVLAIVTGIIGLNTINNQAPEQSSAYDITSAVCTTGETRCESSNYNKKCKCTISGGVQKCQWVTDLSKICCTGYTYNGSSCEPDISAVSLCNAGAGCFEGSSCPTNTTIDSSKRTCVGQFSGGVIRTGVCCKPNTSTGTGSTGTGSTGTGSTGTGTTGTGTSGTGSTTRTGTGSSGTSTNTTASQSICGGSCKVDSDCKITQFGIQPKCSAQGKCVNPVCPNDFNADPQCACKTATSKCGDKCGIWDGGFQPLCGDGISTCSWINGPTCGGRNLTYCMPKTPANGYTAAACTNTTDAKGYKYLVDPMGEPITTQAQILAACAQVAQTKKCYKCTDIKTDGNACESVDVNTTASCPTGYTENSSCNVAAGGTCPVEDITQLQSCGNMDSDGDGKLTVIDLASFAQVFNSSCRNSGFVTNRCGSRDTNNNGKIDVVDFANFANRYAKESCSIN